MDIRWTSGAANDRAATARRESTPFGRTTQKTSFVYQDKRGFLILILLTATGAVVEGTFCVRLKNSQFYGIISLINKNL